MMNYCQDQLKIQRRFISIDQLKEIQTDVDYMYTYLEIEKAIETFSDVG